MKSRVSRAGFASMGPAKSELRTKYFEWSGSGKRIAEIKHKEF